MCVYVLFILRIPIACFTVQLFHFPRQMMVYNVHIQDDTVKTCFVSWEQYVVEIVQGSRTRGTYLQRLRLQ